MGWSGGGWGIPLALTAFAPIGGSPCRLQEALQQIPFNPPLTAQFSVLGWDRECTGDPRVVTPLLPSALRRRLKVFLVRDSLLT